MGGKARYRRRRHWNVLLGISVHQLLGFLWLWECHAGCFSESYRAPTVFDTEVLSVDWLLGMLITAGCLDNQYKHVHGSHFTSAQRLNSSAEDVEETVMNKDTV